MTTRGQRWTLAARPRGNPARSDFRLEDFDLPEPAAGEVRVRVQYHTVAPGVLARLTQETYAPMVRLGAGIPCNGVGIVEASGHPGFAVGTPVAGELAWATHVVTAPAALQPIDPDIVDSGLPLECAIGVLGFSGLSGYFGMQRIGEAKAGDVVVVSSASGAVGSVAGQIARIRGCRVIGIAGSAQKCTELVEVFGFDAALNYKAEADLAAALRALAPQGVDVYFDNVGGAVAHAAVVNMKTFGRIVVCGQTSDYSRGGPSPFHGMMLVISRRLKLQGFLVHDFASEFGQARREMIGWLREGLLLSRPSVVEGIEQSIDAFVKQFEGCGGGRPLVHVQ